MKTIIITILAALTITACSKKDHYVPMQPLPTVTELTAKLNNVKVEAKQTAGTDVVRLKAFPTVFDQNSFIMLYIKDSHGAEFNVFWLVLPSKLQEGHYAENTINVTVGSTIEEIQIVDAGVALNPGEPGFGPARKPALKLDTLVTPASF